MNDDVTKTAGPSTEGPAKVTADDSKKVTKLLGGAITYESIDDYENFLNNLTIDHSILILVSAAKYAQSRGAFSLPEAELIFKSIKAIGKSAKKQAQLTDQEKTSEEPLDKS